MTWRDINIKTFKKINEIIKDETLTDVEKEISLISIIFNLDEDDLYDMDLHTLKTYSDKIAFINTFEPDYGKCPRIERIGDVEVSVDYNLSHFTVAQYIDFMANIQSKERDIARLLACILIPKGKKYNVDYDLEAFIKQIEINLNIYDAESMLFFYIVESLRLLKHSHRMLMMKALGKKMARKMGFKF